MLCSLLFASVFGEKFIRVGSSDLQMGIWHILDDNFGNQEIFTTSDTIDMADNKKVWPSGAPKMKGLSAWDMKIGGFDFYFNFALTNKTVSPSGLKLEYVTSNVYNMTFTIHSAMDAGSALGPKIVPFTAYAVLTDSKAQATFPERTPTKIVPDVRVDDCWVKIKVVKLDGLTHLASAQQKAVETTLQNYLAKTVCDGGASYSKNEMDFGQLGVKGLMKKVGDNFVNEANKYMNPSFRSQRLTTKVNALMPGWMSQMPPIPSMSSSGVSVSGAKINWVKIGSLQAYQNVVNPQMPSNNANGNYIQLVADNITGKGQFYVSAWIGGLQCYANIGNYGGSTSATVTINFNMDSNNFITNPQVNCNVNLGIQLYCPSNNFGGWIINNLKNNFIGNMKNALCNGVTNIVNNKLNNEVLQPAAQVWNGIEANKTDTWYYIDDAKFSAVYTKNWWKSYVNTPSDSLFADFWKGAEFKLDKELGLRLAQELANEYKM